MTRPPSAVDCSTCDGSGEVHSHNPICWECHGKGWVILLTPLQMAKQKFFLAEQQVEKARSDLVKAEADKRSWYVAWAIEKYGLKEGLIVLVSTRGSVDRVYGDRTIDPREEALFDSIHAGHYIDLEQRPWIMVRKKTKDGWSKRAVCAYGDWKPK